MSSITGERYAAIITVEKQQGPSRRQAPGFVEERARWQPQCRRQRTSERILARRTSGRTHHVAQAFSNRTLRFQTFHIEALCIRSFELASLCIIARQGRFHATQRQLGQRPSCDEDAQREQQSAQCECGWQPAR
jgi:hypothetical protein